jgi:hypothetical protein
MMATAGDCFTVPKPCCRRFDSCRGYLTCAIRAGQDLRGKPLVRASLFSCRNGSRPPELPVSITGTRGGRRLCATFARDAGADLLNTGMRVERRRVE